MNALKTRSDQNEDAPEALSNHIYRLRSSCRCGLLSEPAQPGLRQHPLVRLDMREHCRGEIAMVSDDIQDLVLPRCTTVLLRYLVQVHDVLLYLWSKTTTVLALLVIMDSVQPKRIRTPTYRAHVFLGEVRVGPLRTEGNRDLGLRDVVESRSQTKPCRWAKAMASARETTPSLAKIWLTCVVTVRGLMNNRSAISALE
jgi:hypothetical protein